MPFITWSDELSTHNKTIDVQHQKWISIINALNDAMHDRQAEAKLGGLLEELKLYTLYHFHAEEAAFGKVDYPQAEGHIKQHQFFRAKIEELDEHYRRDPYAVSLEVMDFLKTWLVSHIKNMDMTYKDRI